jgi:thiamine-phosphate pyrophosphorylase
VRAKQVSARLMLDIVRAVVARANRAGALVVVNDRADIARITGAGGVHVGQGDLTPAQVRAIVGPDAVVGLSTHTPGQCTDALGQSVSYIAVGPVFGTRTKVTGYEPMGIAGVARAARQIAESPDPRVPLVAIGGITLQNARSVIEAGAQSVAVISDLLAAGDPAERVRQFLRVLGDMN